MLDEAGPLGELITSGPLGVLTLLGVLGELARLAALALLDVLGTLGELVLLFDEELGELDESAACAWLSVINAGAA